METLTQRSINGLFWMASSTAGQGVLQFFVFALLARILTPTDFGVFTAGQSLVLLLQIAFQLGLGFVLIQKNKILEIEVDTAFTLSLFLGVLGGVLVYLSSSSVAAFYKMEVLDGYMKMMAFSLPLQGYIITTEAILKKKLDFKKLASIQLVAYFLSYGVVGIYLAYQGYKGWTLAIAFTSQYLILAFLMYLFIPLKRKLRVSLKHAKNLLSFGGSFTFSECFFSLATHGDKTVIGKILGEEALGFYSRAYRIMLLPSSFFGKVVDQVLLPGISQVQEDNEKLQTLYLRGVSLLATALIPGTLFLYAVAEEVILVALGPQWTGAVEVFQILTLIIYFRTAFNVSDSISKGIGLYRERVINTVVFATFSLILTFLGSQYGGIHGAAYGILIAIFINYFLSNLFVYRKIRFSFGRFIKAHYHGFGGLIPAAITVLINNFYIQHIPVHPVFKLFMNVLCLIVFYLIYLVKVRSPEIEWLMTQTLESVRLKLKKSDV